MNKVRDPRTVYVPFRLTPNEKARLKELARASGVDVSAYIRARLEL